VDGGPTLEQHARDVTAARYVRPTVVAVASGQLLDPAATHRILVVTGRAGAGKSAALESIALDATELGRTARWLDASDLGGHGVESVGPDDVVLVDDVEPAPGLGATLALLPAGVRVVLAGRHLPARWLPGPLDRLAHRVQLAPLSEPESLELVRRLGVGGEPVRTAIVRWAGGLPLALVVAARLAHRSSGPSFETLLHTEGTAELLERLAGHALDRLDDDVLAVLALASRADHALLEELFGDRAEKLVSEARATGLVEVIDRGLALHPSVAHAHAGRLRSNHPARAATWTLRIAAHEHRRATSGDPAALARLAALVGDPNLRTGLDAPSRTGHYGDRWRAGDAALARAALESQAPGAWSLVAPWCDERTPVVRRADGRVVALVATTPLTTTGGLESPRRRLLEPVLAYLEEHGVPGDSTVLTPVQVTFTDRSVPEVAAIRNAAALTTCGVANPRRDVVNLLGDDPLESATLRAFGYVEVPELRRTLDGVPVATWIADVGPGGLAGMLFRTIGAEHVEHMTKPAPGDLARAVESFFSDGALARLDVAPRGLAEADAAERVRTWARSRVLEGLADEPHLADLVLARYLSPGANHDSTMRTLYLSRATYFRRLRAARERLAAL